MRTPCDNLVVRLVHTLGRCLCQGGAYVVCTPTCGLIDEGGGAVAKDKKSSSTKGMDGSTGQRPSKGPITAASPTNNIRNWRLFRKIELQRTLSEMSVAHDPLGIGVSRVNIVRLENGEARWNEDHVMILSRTLGCTPRDLIGTNPFDSGDIFAVYARLSPSAKRRALKAIKAIKTDHPKA